MADKTQAEIDAQATAMWSKLNPESKSMMRVGMAPNPAIVAVAVLRDGFDEKLLLRALREIAINDKTAPKYVNGAEEHTKPAKPIRDSMHVLAQRLVTACAARGLHDFHVKYGAVGDGGVAAHWKTPYVQLLLTLPADEGSTEASYFGVTEQGRKLSGAIGISEPVDFLVEWVMEHSAPALVPSPAP